MGVIALSPPYSRSVVKLVAERHIFIGIKILYRIGLNNKTFLSLRKDYPLIGIETCLMGNFLKNHMFGRRKSVKLTLLALITGLKPKP